MQATAFVVGPPPRTHTLSVPRARGRAVGRRKRHLDDEDYFYAEDRVKGPALAMRILALISAALVFVGIVFDLWLLMNLEDAPAPRRGGGGGSGKEFTLIFRLGWGMLLLGSNIATYFCAEQMRKLRSYGMAQAACVLCLIPCFGPCFIFGIPFGIWGLMALNDRDVHRAFRR